MKKQPKFNSIKMLSLAIVAAVTIIIGVVFTWKSIAAEQQDKIEYNAVYECGGLKSKFKVFSCKGTGKFDRCDIFYINELSPGGGHKGSPYRAQIEDDIKQGCKIKGRPASTSETNENKPSENETNVSNTDKTPVRKETDGTVACSPSSKDSDGKTANEKTFRGVIRRLWEAEAKEGSDGAVTISFQKAVIGAPRAWRPTLTDAYSQADPKKPIYPVRASFSTCTDYKTAISKRNMERIYDCFVHKAGGWQCTQTGESGALALKDKKEYIPKKGQ